MYFQDTYSKQNCVLFWIDAKKCIFISSHKGAWSGRGKAKGANNIKGVPIKHAFILTSRLEQMNQSSLTTPNIAGPIKVFVIDTFQIY